jgi:hypothetical protein
VRKARFDKTFSQFVQSQKERRPADLLPGSGGDRARACTAYTDPAKAGPDYALQGEYKGEVPGEGEVGAQVIAEGGGKFTARFLHGGPPGAGWDGSTEVKTQAKTEGGKAVINDPEGTAEIGDGKITGKTKDGVAFTPLRVEQVCWRPARAFWNRTRSPVPGVALGLILRAFQATAVARTRILPVAWIY